MRWEIKLSENLDDGTKEMDVDIEKPITEYEAYEFLENFCFVLGVNEKIKELTDSLIKSVIKEQQKEEPDQLYIYSKVKELEGVTKVVSFLAGERVVDDGTSRKYAN